MNRKPHTQASPGFTEGLQPPESDAHRERRILRKRAADLARPRVGRDTSPDDLELIVFPLGEERYAFESCQLREVVTPRSVTPLPTAPLWVAGIISLRGQILSVLDLRPLLGLASRKDITGVSVLVLKSEQMEFGVLADGPPALSRIRLGDLQRQLPSRAAAGGEYVEGITADAVAILDAQRLLADDKLVVNEEVIND